MKKNTLLLIVIAMIASLTNNAQVAINSDGSAPDSSAMVEIKSSTGGFLMPRMTTLEQTAIDDPATGLLIFNTDSLNFWYFNGIYWLSLNISAGDTIYSWNCGDDLDYGGQSYSTVQIGTQCWMAENLNIGTRINGGVAQTGPGIKKYCYNNSDVNCGIYGGLYQWNMMMQSVTDTATQGICPDGWHIPTDYEWEVLEGTIDTQYGIGDAEWDGGGFRGSDAGTFLKSTTIWVSGAGTDIYDFTGLPAGIWNASVFAHWSEHAAFWSSNEGTSSSYAIDRYLGYESAGVGRDQWALNYGFSVRCLKD